MFYLVVMGALFLLTMFSVVVYTVEIMINIEDIKELDKNAQTLTAILGFDVFDQEEKNMKVFTTIFHFPGGTSTMLEEIYYAKSEGKASSAKVRYEVKGNCEQLWRNFPFDKHDCKTKIYLKRISPNQYHIDIVVSKTNKKIYQNSPLDGLSISNITSYECENKVLQEGVKQCIMLQISLYRSFLPILIKFFIPSIIMSFVVWITLFINRENIVARILMLGISTAVQIYMTWNLNQDLPRVGYFTSLDKWQIIIYSFIFVTFLQVISIHILLNSAHKYLALSIDDKKITSKSKYRHLRTENRRKQNITQKLNLNGRASSTPVHETTELMENSIKIDIECGPTFRKKFEHYVNHAKIIELFGRLINPILFLVAVVLYFLFNFINRI